jgi:hypothetical protein
MPTNVSSKIEPPIGKGRERGRGREGVGADFMSYVRKFYGWIQKDQRAALKDKFELTMFRKMS